LKHSGKAIGKEVFACSPRHKEHLVDEFLELIVMNALRDMKSKKF